MIFYLRGPLKINEKVKMAEAHIQREQRVVVKKAWCASPGEGEGASEAPGSGEGVVGAAHLR